MRTDQSAVVTWPLDAYLVSDGLFGWEAVGPHLRECALQLVMQCPELSVPPVHIPLIVLYPDVDLPMRETGRQAESELLRPSSQRQVLHHCPHRGHICRTPLRTKYLAQNGGTDSTNGHQNKAVRHVTGELNCIVCPQQAEGQQGYSSLFTRELPLRDGMDASPWSHMWLTSCPRDANSTGLGSC